MVESFIKDEKRLLAINLVSVKQKNRTKKTGKKGSI